VNFIYTGNKNMPLAKACFHVYTKFDIVYNIWKHYQYTEKSSCRLILITNRGCNNSREYVRINEQDNHVVRWLTWLTSRI